MGLESQDSGLFRALRFDLLEYQGRLLSYNTGLCFAFHLIQPHYRSSADFALSPHPYPQVVTPKW